MAHPPNNDNLPTYKIVVVGDGGGKFNFYMQPVSISIWATFKFDFILSLFI